MTTRQRARRSLTLLVTLLVSVTVTTASGGNLAQQQNEQLREEIAQLKRSYAALQQQIELMKQIDELKKAQDEIRRELAEIKQLLRQRTPSPESDAQPTTAAARDIVIDVGGNPVIGAATAKLTLVEFTDYQCPYCSRFIKETYPQIVTEYVTPGKIRYVTLDLPLESIHPLAFKAALAAHCAGDQGKYSEMKLRLFANQEKLEPWSGHAETLGLDPTRFEACMNSDKTATNVRNDMNEARKAGVRGTPTFLLGFTDPKSPDRVRGVSVIRGALQFQNFRERIDQALAATR